METAAQTPKQNPLGYEKISKLLFKFAIPSIISMLVGALYNIVDQIFIGQGVGMLGNAATNVAFPLVTIATAIALLLGIGSAANFNLSLGAGDKQKAAHIAGNGFVLLAASGVALCLLVLLFLRPLLQAFGSTAEVLPYAETYTRITAYGLPFLIFTTGASHIIRADGSPVYSMACTLVGAILNTILDPIFIFVFHMGMAGAAFATVIGQIVSAILALRYLLHFRSVRFERSHFRLSGVIMRHIASLGIASCFNQLAMTIMQITLNNTLTYYGEDSIYGSNIPLAAVGVISKVNIVFMAFMVGIAQGNQPIVGYNYGARRYDRVKKAYFTALLAVSIIALMAFAAFQLFPRQITSIFGQGQAEYFQFAERYLRIFMMLTCLNGIQPLSANFFTSIGKATKGILISLTRQILFLIPLILLLPRFWGIDGVMYAGPLADGAAAIVAILLVWNEMQKMGKATPPLGKTPLPAD